MTDPLTTWADIIRTLADSELRVVLPTGAVQRITVSSRNSDAGVALEDFLEVCNGAGPGGEHAPLGFRLIDARFKNTPNRGKAGDWHCVWLAEDAASAAQDARVRNGLKRKGMT